MAAQVAAVASYSETITENKIPNPSQRGCVPAVLHQAAGGGGEVGQRSRPPGLARTVSAVAPRSGC
ncbi:hypothetical protein HaLaN_16240 [Haematococcus lacustris]|uniref:Uncharacterized protein n=1 Tax=Haematococcus lacustris TaxID=44745 RepID=A0A699ZAY2_HAELA|nr:hypothetical protein HaLaN_16240 [Haematococcus lacustris]